MTTRTNSNISSLIFSGVTAGYFKGNEYTPTEAAKAYERALKEHHADTKVYPSVCVYHTDWGCPVGGEAVASFTLVGDAAEILSLCESLRQEFEQSTLSVSLPTQGTPTLGFTAEVKGVALADLGSKWQVAAAQEMKVSGVYVSCGIAQVSEDTCIISAEANPAFVQDLSAWRKAVEKIAAEIGVTPVFVETNFNYLQK